MANEGVQLQIEKLVYGGDGLARLEAEQPAAGKPARRMAVFVPLSLPGETVQAQLLQAKGGMARAELLRVERPSVDRTQPRCEYFGRCGGCQLQHGSYNLQIAAKAAILQETLERARLDITAPIETIAADPWQYRNRIRLHVRQFPRWQVGYLERKSHRFLPVQHCPIAQPLLQHAIAAMASVEVASLAPQALSEVEIFINHDQKELTLAAFSSSDDPEFASQFAEWIAALQQALPQLRGAAAFGERSATQAAATITTAGPPWLTTHAGGEEFCVSTGSFFQVNANLLDSLIVRVIAAVSPAAGQQVFDLYAGVGLFSKPLARAGAQVTAVESAPASSGDLAHNLLQFANATTVRSTTEAFLARVKQAPSAIVVDPPRAGLGTAVTQHLVRLAAPALVYLSCDPTTLARDLQPLLASGYRIESLTMVDLFPQTFHLETLAVLRHT